MRRRIVAGNWKMNTTYTEAMALVDALKESLTDEVVGETGVIITPPALYLSDVVESLVDNPYIAVAAQNCHHKESGAYTGEWSAAMLASLDIDAIIIGHSERREYFGETNEACFVRFTEIFTSLTVPYNYRIDIQRGEHCSTPFAGVGAGFFVVTILSSNRDIWIIY